MRGTRDYAISGRFLPIDASMFCQLSCKQAGQQGCTHLGFGQFLAGLPGIPFARMS